MKWHLYGAIIIAFLSAAGCKSTESGVVTAGKTEPKQVAAQSVVPDKSTDKPAETTSQDVQANGEEDSHNALFDGEDSASRDRRNKAKASLGLGK